MENVQVKPYYMECEGIIVPAVFSPNAVRSALNYQHREGDLFIVTYPKCGTTWMQYIVMLILRNGKPHTDMMDFFINSPSLEMCGADVVNYKTDKGAIKTHLPFHRMKLNPKARYIYVARNPRDCLVSFYHHAKNTPLFMFRNGNFDDFFELFMEGKVEHGDYFDHLLSGYVRRNDPNVYFTTYERLKRNTKEEILKIAEFIDEKYGKLLKEQPNVLDEVIYYSSFDYMKNKTTENFRTFKDKIGGKIEQGEKVPEGLKEFIRNVRELNAVSQPKTEFVRKGVIGDWKNHLSEQQQRRLDERIKERTANSDVMKLWTEEGETIIL